MKKKTKKFNPDFETCHILIWLQVLFTAEYVELDGG
jgi:hypothetical protein